MQRATRHAALTRLIVWRFVHISVAVRCCAVLGCIVVVVGREMRDWEREGKEETKRGMCVYTPIIKGHNKIHTYIQGR
jgi:hypothetical protein